MSSDDEEIREEEKKLYAQKEFMKLNPNEEHLKKLREFLKENKRNKNEQIWKKSIREIIDKNLKKFKTATIYDYIHECIEYAEKEITKENKNKDNVEGIFYIC